MATVNKRVYSPQAVVINGVNDGGLMTAVIDSGFDNILRSSPDGLQVAVKDKEIQYVRGEIVSQDWSKIIDLLTGAADTYIFYEHKGGSVEEDKEYIKHTITNPVIYDVRLSLSQKGYMTVRAAFECMAADETKGVADMWTQTDDQAAPTYIPAARGGYRVKSTAFKDTAAADPADDIDIYHVTAFDFGIVLPLAKACNDSDVGYTAVDAKLDGLNASGSITFQDAEIGAVSARIKCQDLLLNTTNEQLVITVAQGFGGADKVITINGVDFGSIRPNAGSGKEYTDYTAAFDVANFDMEAQLTLAGANKIITIA